ncbi:MAG: hypothetical protein DRJ64_00105 [Thermoprotei archaeon]|nr:MAG: hypothetical protein DRJ64_00105 [Thermoprotei archaeon]
MKIGSFIFYRDWDPSKYDEALRELRENGISFIILAKKYNLPRVYDDHIVAEELREFMEMAYEKYNIWCIIPAWSGTRPTLFIDKDFTRNHAIVVAKAVRELMDLEGFYAVYLDDEPYNCWEFSVERVRNEYNDLFEEETGYRLPDRGKVRGRWNYETAMTFYRWVSEKYVSYLRTVIEEYKKICPRIKSLINFYLPNLLPSTEAPVDVYGIIETVDIVSHDIYPGWHYYYCRSLENMVAFQTRFLRSLTDKPVWTILQGHKIMLGYAPTLEQIDRWAMDAVSCGSDCVGWYVAEHEYMMGAAIPVKTTYTKYGCFERWRKMLETSKKITSMEKKQDKTEIAILVSYDSVITYDYRPLIYAFVTLYKDAGIIIDFITEKHLEKKTDLLENYRFIFLGYTPILRRYLLSSLENFVEEGGILIACCNDLRFDEKLKDLNKWRKKFLGITKEKVIWKEDSIRLTDKVSGLDNNSIKAFWERHAMTVSETSTEVLGTWSNGLAAIISRKIGNGQIIYIGTRPYLANCIIGEKNWVKFIKSLLKMDNS